MPRKPKPPMPIITIHGLSGCKAFVELQASYVCDITGELMPMNHEALAQHVVSDPKVITDYRKRVRAVRLAQEYLKVKRYTDQRDRAHKLITDQLNPPKPEPKPAFNQVHTESGWVITVPSSANSIKRRL